VKLKSETGADFLKVCPGPVVIELVSVVSEEDKVSLIVKGNNPTFLQLRVLGEQTGNHSAHPGSQHGVEVI